MNITFDQIGSTDIDSVLGLFKEAAKRINLMNIDHWQYWKNPPLEKVQWVEEGIKGNEFYFIKVSENDTVGMVRIMQEDILYWGKQEGKAHYIHSLVVKEKYNGKGLGAEIINAIAERARENNCEFLRLDADANNPKLCNYYKRLGFNKVGIRKLPLSVYNLYQIKL
tara:strand:- start:945 stop:1445 length:501 start_codon:yes stop_codon:yes gene_type:complete